MVPAHFEKQLIMYSIQVVPQALLDPNHDRYRPIYGSYAQGGKYLVGDFDVTGWTVQYPSIEVGRGLRQTQFVCDLPVAPLVRRPGERVVRVNLFRQSAGWRWINLGNERLQEPWDTLVSVEHGGRHLYGIFVSADALILERYPQARSEPRLRPTGYCRDVLLGSQVGTIDVRGRQHTVYHSMRLERAEV